MKRFAFIILALVLLCAFLTACSGSNSSELPETSSPTETSGNESKSEPGETLWIVTDLGKQWAFNHESNGQEGGELDLMSAVEYFGGLPGGPKIELEVLPTADADLKARLTRLKTEIMAGEGPDVFILSSDLAGTNLLTQKRLFQNPERAMESGMFLLLDDYLENAKFMDFDQLNQTVMAAGRTEQGQFILPMYYCYGAAKINSALPAEDIPVSWDGVVAGENKTVKSACGEMAFYMFHNVFPTLSQGEDLVISEGELLQRIKEAVGLRRQTGAGDFQLAPITQTDMIHPPLFEDAVWEPSEGESTMIPMPDTEGGVTVSVSTYAAINKNTTKPDAAFALLDILLSKEFQSCERFWKSDQSAYPMTLFSGVEGVPVHDGLLQEETTFAYSRYIPQELFSTYSELREQITTARLCSEIDLLMDDLYTECRNAKSDEEIEKVVHKAYMTATMMLEES